jgi:hypothetical protein
MSGDLFRTQPEKAGCIVVKDVALLPLVEETNPWSFTAKEFSKRSKATKLSLLGKDDDTKHSPKRLKLSGYSASLLPQQKSASLFHERKEAPR